MALFFYVVAICLAAYAHYYIGPEAVGPWRPTNPNLLHERIQLRTDDLLTKWGNQQKQKKLEMKQQKRDKRVEQENAHKAEIKADV